MRFCMPATESMFCRPWELDDMRPIVVICYSYLPTRPVRLISVARASSIAVRTRAAASYAR